MSKLTVEKEVFISASVEKVFRYWLEPKKIARWILPPGVSEPAQVTNHPSEGGTYTITVEQPEGAMTISGTYEKIVPNQLLVFSWLCTAFPGEETRVSVRFASEADGTRITLAHENFIATESREAHSMGWDNCFKQMDELN